VLISFAEKSFIMAAAPAHCTACAFACFMARAKYCNFYQPFTAIMAGEANSKSCVDIKKEKEYG
jgi:hypothetical protein